jgi:hypothetical protein
MTFYSREIEMPHTRLQGLCNFVQMVINQIESGDHRNALLTAVDLLDTLQGQSNPFSSVTSEKDNAMLAELKRQHMQEVVEAMDKARADGFAAGVDAEKDRMAKALGLIAA